MSRAWQQQQERGSHTGIRVMVWVAVSLGRAVARTLLYPICLYFLLSSGSARRAIGRFRERALGRSTGWTDLFRHYHAFASTILDRIYFLGRRFELFDIQLHGVELLDQTLARGGGCILLGSHLGSFEVLRALGFLHRHLDIRVLMDEHNAPLVRDLIQSLNPDVAETAIQVGGVETMLHVKECLDRGGIIGLMGDRVRQNDQAVVCKFFGAEARFPTGAIRLARVTRAPVLLFFGLYRGGNRYEVHLEPFSEAIGRFRDHPTDDVKQWTQRYADRLESVCRYAPDNWFNFYDFWADSG